MIRGVKTALDQFAFGRRGFQRFLGSMSLDMPTVPLAPETVRAAVPISYMIGARHEVPELHESTGRYA